MKLAATSMQSERRILFPGRFRTIIDSPHHRIQRLAHAGILTVLSLDRDAPRFISAKPWLKPYSRGQSSVVSLN
jgi:hypothetical protein